MWCTLENQWSRNTHHMLTRAWSYSLIIKAFTFEYYYGWTLTLACIAHITSILTNALSDYDGRMLGIKTYGEQLPVSLHSPHCWTLHTCPHIFYNFFAPSHLLRAPYPLTLATTSLRQLYPLLTQGLHYDPLTLANMHHRSTLEPPTPCAPPCTCVHNRRSHHLLMLQDPAYDWGVP